MVVIEEVDEVVLARAPAPGDAARAGRPCDPPLRIEEWPSEAKAAMKNRMEQLRSEIIEIERKLEHARRKKKKGVQRQPERDVNEPSETTPPVLQKWYSVKSQQVLDELTLIRDRLDSLTSVTAEAEAEVYAAKGAINPAVRDLLAQVYGDVTRLVSSGGALLSTGEDATTEPLDSISTMALRSGQDVARAERKALVKRAEALAERVMSAIGLIDDQREAHSARPR